MKVFLHKIIVIVIGVSFLSAYFEFNEAEKKQNYEKESHTYITAEKQTHNYSSKIIEKGAIPFFHFETFILEQLSGNIVSTIYVSPPIISEKLFLWHSVFLI